jgi:diguanylate cyclase (GGDEF)-like protein
LAIKEDPRVLARRVLNCLADPFENAGDRLVITASIGVAVTDNSRYDARELLREADMAMYRAKERGRDRIEVFHPELRDRAAERYKMALEIRTAKLSAV